MNANDYQVGGNHYRKAGSTEQHWDRLVRLYGIDVAFVYFVGNITAYVERYREKNGVEDLKKARHYIDKLIELEEANKQFRDSVVRTYGMPGEKYEDISKRLAEELQRTVTAENIQPPTYMECI